MSIFANIVQYFSLLGILCNIFVNYIENKNIPLSKNKSFINSFINFMQILPHNKFFYWNKMLSLFTDSFTPKTST